MSCCDFKGVSVLRETAERSVALEQCVSELFRFVTISSAVDAHTRPPPSRCCNLRPAPRSDGRYNRRPSQIHRRERSIISVAHSRLTSISVMFFPVTEAETRQKLLRNVKKEVGRVLFLPPSQLVVAGAFAFVHVCLGGRRSVRMSHGGLFTMTLGLI